MENDVIKYSDLIWSILNCYENQYKSRQEQIALIKPIIADITETQRIIGKHQVLNHLQEEINDLVNLNNYEYNNKV